MKFVKTSIPEVLLIEPEIYEDFRGNFLEIYQYEKFVSAGIDYRFVQDNQSFSRQGVLRGLHYQINHIQGKLVRVTQGIIFDVAVDLRKHSPTFGRWVGVTLSHEDYQILWIPPKFAHGYHVISDTAVVNYKTTDYYDAPSDRCILWNDNNLGIEWPIAHGEKPILSEKDKNGTPFQQAEVFSD